eukprot:COSAG04_NODE_4746_length_1914_cov_0.737741_2_plen_124_part_00
MTFLVRHLFCGAPRGAGFMRGPTEKKCCTQPKAMFSHTRRAPPRYEIRRPDDAAVPCANVEHVAAALLGLGGPLLSPSRVFAIVRGGGRAASLPAGVAVHKLTVAERAARPAFLVTRTIEAVD